jgi:hypothetical protein
MLVPACSSPGSLTITIIFLYINKHYLIKIVTSKFIKFKPTAKIAIFNAIVDLLL